MSGIGPSNNKSILPEDVEQQLADIQTLISNLGIEKSNLERDIKNNKLELEKCVIATTEANTELNRVVSLYETKKREMDTREKKLDERDSILGTWAADLAEKEKRINKYLAIFDNMKKVISNE